MNVAVLGATGYIGSHLIPALLAEGHSVRAIARHAEVLEGRGWQGVEAVAADLLEAGSLEAALADCEVVYYLVHSMAGGRGFASRDREAATNARVAAERAGATRLIYLGGLQPAREASEHLASRRDTGEVLRAGSLPVTELRAGIIVGPGSAAFEVVRDLVYHLPAMLTPRWVRSRTQPIALEDIVAYLVAVLDAPETQGGTYDVGGPEVLSYEQMLHQFGQLVGRNPRIIRVPVLTPRLSSYWLDLVTAVPASIARPLVEGLRHDLLADDEAIRRLVPLRLRTYREAVQAALDGERGDTRAGRWSEGALPFRRFQSDIAYYSKTVTVERDSTASPAALWAAVSSVGGRAGWPYWNALWRARGWVDRAVGGIGMRRGRRHSTNIRVGDALDFWRVVAVEPGTRLALVAEMKLPGSAVLEFQVTPAGDGASRLTTTARYHPAGIPGLLYWYSLVPIHARIFRGLTDALVERAEASEVNFSAHSSTRETSS